MFNAIRRLLVALGLMIEKSTETEAIDEAMIERGIRDQRAKADAANTANGQLQTTIILLKEQIREEERNAQNLTNLLRQAAAQNDELNGANYAEQLDNAQQEMARNKEQLDKLNEVYAQNVRVIATALKEVERYQKEFVSLKARVKASKSLAGLSDLVKNSMSQLQGMTEVGQAMGRMKERAAGGEGQMTATMDLAKAMGGNIAEAQSERNARGRALFAQFKASGSLTNAEVAPVAQNAATSEPKPAERQKISES